MKRIVPASSVLIPEAAHRVFKGVIFDVYQWEQELYNGTVKTFEMLRRPDSIAVMVVRGSDILISTDEQPQRGILTSLPGGRGLAGENWLDGAKRELHEETGIACSTWKLLDVRQPLHKIEHFVVLYVASGITEQSKPHPDGGEKISLEWRNYVEFRQAVLAYDIPSLNYLREVLERYETVKSLLDSPEFTGKTVDISD